MYCNYIKLNIIYNYPIYRGQDMKKTDFINLTTYESDNKSELMAVCSKYGINENRIYWNNFSFYLDIFHNEIK